MKQYKPQKQVSSPPSSPFLSFKATFHIWPNETQYESVDKLNSVTQSSRSGLPEHGHMGERWRDREGNTSGQGLEQLKRLKEEEETEGQT